MRYLLVEDNEELAEAVVKRLVLDGHAVDHAPDLAQARACLADASYDLILLDVMLPGRSGFDILRDLRAAPQTRSLPVLMLTAKGQAKDRETAMSLGADAFLTKPFSNSELVETLTRVVSGEGAEASDPQG